MTIRKMLKVSLSAILSLAIIASVIVMPAVVSADTVAVPSDNLVVNGNFEGITSLPTQFETVSGYEAKFDGYYAIQNTDIPDGFTGNNLKMSWNKNDFSTFTFFTVRVPVESGVMYTVSYNMYTPDTTGKINYRFSFGTEKWNGSNWGSYGNGRLDTTVMAINGKVSKNVTATSNELWLLFGVKDGRATVDGDAVVYFDNISVTPATDSVLNGSFENDLTDGWIDTTYTDFSSVNAAAEGITAIDGNNVMKISTVKAWQWRTQTVPVKANTEYEFSFWIYRVDDTSNSVYKLGNSSSETAYNPNGSQTWLNSWVGYGKWVKIRRTFNTGSDTKVKISFLSQDTTALTYIDKVELNPLTNYVQNGSFENDLIDAWNAQTYSDFSKVKASDEGITAVDGENVLKIATVSAWNFRSQTITVEANTDYIFSFWVYRVGNGVSVYKLGNSSKETAYNPDGTQTYLNNEASNTWVKKTVAFNSGSDTTVKLILCAHTGTTYLDNFKLQKKVNVTATASEGGTVAGLPTNVGFGDNITLTATAKKGYTFDGWYIGEEKVSDSAIYNFTAKNAADYSAKFTVDSSIISDGGFEDSVLNAGWNNGYGALSLVTDEVYEGNQAALIKPLSAWQNVRWDLNLEANKNYVIKFAVKRVGSSKAIIKLENPSNINILEGAPSNGNYEIGEGTNWTTKAFYFNTGDSTSFKLFFTGANTNVATYIDNLVIEEIGTEVVNGGFEEHYDKGWVTDYHSNFSVVNASESAPVSAIEGSKVLKTTADSDGWRNLVQRVELEANTEYVVSFWYYRENSGYISLKFGNSTADNGFLKESWLNNDAQNKWIYKQWKITTTDDATLKLFISAFNGTAYIDNVCITKVDTIGNLIQNGDMSDKGIGLNAWSVAAGDCFTYDAEAEGYTGTGALKIVGDGNETNWKNMTYTFNVKANTDYVFRFYSKNSSSTDKMVYKVLNNSNVSFIGGDRWTNGDGADGNGADWGKNEWKINSGENTVIKVLFVERTGGTTYVDDIYFGEAIVTATNTTNEKLGKISSDKAYAGEDDEITFTANATAGGIFIGWRIGDSEDLIEGETYSYKGFDDINITAVFAAKVGNINEDEAINATDLAALRGLILNAGELPLLGDLDGNGVVDARDVVALKRAIVGA